MNCLCGKSPRFFHTRPGLGAIPVFNRCTGMAPIADFFFTFSFWTAKQSHSRLTNYNKPVLLFSVAKYEIESENSKQLSQLSGAMPVFNFCRDECTGIRLLHVSGRKNKNITLFLHTGPAYTYCNALSTSWSKCCVIKESHVIFVKNVWCVARHVKKYKKIYKKLTLAKILCWTFRQLLLPSSAKDKKCKFLTASWWYTMYVNIKSHFERIF